MPAHLGERLRRLAETEPEPIRTVLLRVADELLQLNVAFSNEVLRILLEAELEITDRFPPHQDEP